MKKAALWLCAGASLCASTAALAQPAAEPADNGDIIVTAQRRSENLLSVPLSVSAVTGEGLVSAGIQDMTSLRFTTPGYTSGTGTGYTQVFIRGIGNRIYVGADPSVATFIDDVPRTFGSLVDQLMNVDRVEVLKGAQGGLYGRNATGGVVNIITRQPGDDFAAEAKAGYGSRDTLELSAYMNLPITDGVAMNLTASRSRHDNYTPNVAPQNPYASYKAANPAYTGRAAQIAALDGASTVSAANDQDVWAVDGKIAFKGDRFRVTIGGDYSQDSDDSGPFSFQRDPNTAYQTYAFFMGAFGFGPEILPQSYIFPATGDKFDVAIGFDSYTKQKDYGFSAKAEINLDGVDITSISAIRWNESQFSGDLAAAAVPVAGFQTDFRRRTQYQELRALSTSDGPFSWMAGATYYHENLDYFIRNIGLGFPAGDTSSKTKADAWSVYAQGTYEVTDRVNLTGSLRYVYEKKVADYPAQVTPVYDPGTGLVTSTAVAAVSGSATAKKLLPSVTINYELDGTGTVYARWAQGLKTGGPNPVVHPASVLGTTNSFLPEKVDTYEVGLRTRLLDGALDFTSAIFYNDYKNLQLTRTGFTGLPFYFLNARSARTWGAEVGLNWRPARTVSIAANLGYLNAKYRDFSFAGEPRLAVLPFNNNGQQMVYAPKWQGSVGVNVDQPVSDRLNVVGNLLYSYSSRYDVDLNAPLTMQKAYSLVNLRAGVKTSDDRIGIYVAARNLFNVFYATFGQRDAVGSEQVPGARRIIMGQVEYKF